MLVLVLKVALPIHPTEVLYLDEDTCSDLVNRFGRKLRKLLSLPFEQILVLLEGLKKGGHIRWHILMTEQTVVSSNFRDGCWNTYGVSVGVEKTGLEVVSNALDETSIRKFIQSFGVDLDEIRKLGRDQVAWVFRWLLDAGMVEWSEVQQNQAPGTVGSSEPLGNYNTDPSTYIPPSSVDPSLLTDNRILSCPVNYPIYAGDEFDLLLEPCNGSPEGQDAVDFPRPEPATITMASVTSPESDPGALCYPTPSYSINSPPTSQPLSHPVLGDSLPQYQSINTPLSTDSPFPALQTTPLRPVSSRGPDANASSYPTPSTCYANSPPANESLSSSVSSRTKLQLLQSYRFGKDGNESLEKTHIKKILRAEAGLLSEDPSKLLLPLLGPSEDDTLPALHALGLPLQWRGIKGAVDYYRLLEAEKQQSFLDPLAKRIARILFNLNYRWLGKHEKKGTSVAALILNACPKERNTKSRRDNITTYHKRRGEWTWTLAACLGIGILVHAGETIDAIINYSFSPHQLNAFISLVLRTRPGSVRLFHSYGPVINAIMLGKATIDLRPIILAGNSDLVRQEALECAYIADQEALVNQQTEETLLAKDIKSIADGKITDVIPDF